MEAKRAAPPESPAKTAELSRTVTLLTGDRVTVRPRADGDHEVLIDPRPRDRQEGFQVERRNGQVTVIPNDVAAMVPAILDPALFNVTGLMEMGYDDATRASIPVIIQKGSGVSASFLDESRPLTSIQATAGVIAKDKAAELGADLSSPGTQRDSGTSKIWLDRPMRVTSAHAPSTPRDGYLNQIEAPSAWQAGLDGRGIKVAVLDTGIDTGHPALAGKVIAKADFTDGSDPEDKHGHGSHVASLIAGNGAGSNSARQGVAPAAELLSGKVLANNGSGQESWVIAGMEWAVTQKADIVNMSLGASAGRADDAITEALERLTAENGTLFVVAAGNSGWYGRDMFTIGSPGIAASALTVAAVQADDTQAAFSGEGPTLGTYRMKPDLAAPGVDIPGAKAGARDGDLYVPMSGTSQATPIVAGAAALLLQQDSTRTWQQVKAQLTGTANATKNESSWTHGSGRLDLKRAITTQVTADLASFDFGCLRHPDDAPRRQMVTLTNHGTTPITMAIADEQKNEEGALAPADAVMAHPTTLTIPAHGKASATITLEPSRLDEGMWQGAVTIGDLRLPLGLYDEPVRHDLSIKVLDRAGVPARNAKVTVINIETGTSESLAVDAAGALTARLEPSHYSLFAQITTPAANGRPETFTVAGTPEMTVSGDTSYLIDARKGERLHPPTIENVETHVVEADLVYMQKAVNKQGILNMLTFKTEQISAGRVFIQPTSKVTRGTFEVSHRWRLEPMGEVKPNEPEVYELQLPSDRFTSPLSPHIDRRALEKMARVENTFAGVSAAGEQSVGRAFSTPFSNTALISWRPTSVPSTRVELLSAHPDALWSQCLTVGRARNVRLCDPLHQAYARSQRVRTTFGTGLHPEAVNIMHAPGMLAVTMGLADTDHTAFVPPQLVRSSRLALYRNGALVGEWTNNPAGYFPVSNERGHFRLEHSWVLDPNHFDVAGKASTIWEFTSAAPTDPAAEPQVTPPLLDVGYDADVDGLGRAEADRPLHMNLKVSHLSATNAPKVTGTQLRYSIDGGAQWRKVTLRRTQDGYRATVPPKVLHSGTKLSFRVTAIDSAGGRVDQTVENMITVR